MLKWRNMSPAQIARRARSRIATAAKRKVYRDDFFPFLKDGLAKMASGDYTAQEVFGFYGVPTWSTR